MKRLPDWPERLCQLIEERRHMKFSWGSNDCALFAADGVRVITGVDLAASYRGQYATDFGAARILEEAGGLRALAAALEEKPKGFIHRGDVVIAELEWRETMGICSGAGMWCAPGPDGLLFRPVAEVVVVLKV